MPKTWPAIDLTPGPGFDERLALILDDLEAVAIDESEDGHTRRAYFETALARDHAVRVIREQLGSSLDVRPTEVEDEGWAFKVQQELRAVRVGRVVVSPPWDVPSTSGDDIVIVIEPSTGFGTGHHQSTRLCLRALQETPLDGATVLDVGTGSGVLALAAVRLGAAHAVAIDSDEDSTAAARENVSRNDPAARVEVRLADAGADALPPADVVVANLTAILLGRYADAIVSAIVPGGRLVVSGFTADQVRLVTHAFDGMTATARYDEDDWVALVLTATGREAGAGSRRQPVSHE